MDVISPLEKRTLSPDLWLNNTPEKIDIILKKPSRSRNNVSMPSQSSKSSINVTEVKNIHGLRNKVFHNTGGKKPNYSFVSSNSPKTS